MPQYLVEARLTTVVRFIIDAADEQAMVTQIEALMDQHPSAQPYNGGTPEAFVDESSVLVVNTRCELDDAEVAFIRGEKVTV